MLPTENELKSKLLRQFKRSLQPSFTDLKIEWGIFFSSGNYRVIFNIGSLPVDLVAPMK